jgi:hypothetical protein
VKPVKWQRSYRESTYRVTVIAVAGKRTWLNQFWLDS